MASAFSPCVRGGNRLFLRCALAAAELQGEGLVVAPILVDFREEFSGLGEVRGERSEDFDFVAQHVLAEAFVTLPVGDEVIQYSRDRLGREPRGDRLYGEPKTHDAVFVITATEQHLVIGQ